MRNTVELSLAIAAVLAGHVAVAQDSEQGTVEEVIVLGRGETRQVQSVSFEQIDALPAGTSPLKAIEKMPGVNFQSADAYGAYEWSTRISIRGFNQSQLGFTLDGVPLGDMSYANHNGLHVSRAIPSEAVGRVQLSQGAGAIDIASTSISAARWSSSRSTRPRSSECAPNRCSAPIQLAARSLSWTAVSWAPARALISPSWMLPPKNGKVAAIRSSAW